MKMYMMLEELWQLYEDLQAKLGEAIELSTSLEDWCSSLEDQLVKAIEELDGWKLSMQYGEEN